MNQPLFFFTAEDPREIPKGSRDPLRFLPIWSKVARQMIPYLTTVTPSYRGFLTRFLFHAAIEELNPKLANGSKKEQWDAFNKFEQLCAIVRSHSEPKTENFPGKSEVFKRNKGGRAVISTDIDDWLMRSQENTGFWGYYHQACLGSNILKLNSHPNSGYILTEDARTVLENSSAKALILQYRSSFEMLFKQKKFEFLISDFQALADFFSQKPYESGELIWQQFWQSHILTPDPMNGFSDTYKFNNVTQLKFAESVSDLLRASPQSDVYAIWETLNKNHIDDDVRKHAQLIGSTEAIIGLCEWVFDACRQRKDGGEDLTKARAWAVNNGYNELWLDKLRHIKEPKDPDLREYRDIALSHDSFEKLAEVLLKRHKKIMAQRKGATWVELLDDNSLNIRQTCSEPMLPKLDENSSGIRWRYDYFLSSWVAAASEIGFIGDSKDE